MGSEDYALPGHAAVSPVLLVYTIVLNYKTWQFTQDCISSLLAGDYPAQHIIVVDNASPNDSVSQLNAFFGTLDANPQRNDSVTYPITHYQTPTGPITFIRSPVNEGYAAGNNIGLKHALAGEDAAFFWVLNNDTTVATDALSKLVSYSTDPQHTHSGLIGSLLLHYDQPRVVQTIGGRHIPWLGISVPVGEGLSVDPGALSRLMPQVNYVVGAACFLNRQTLIRVGFIPDDYFLYYEDTAWSLEAQKKGFVNNCCLDSLVYHREGASTRSTTDRLSERAEYYFARNKIRFTRRYYPHYLPLMLFSATTAMLVRIWAGNFAAVKTIGLATWKELMNRK